ncbi:hypothetical protein F1C16_14820 [Hymenobacter sp. NBH84]|uniref:hypothetical protein n=1 Tax=Hymenobacter sp. NBH84 TaxID=2596915 RepID=UPI00162447BA|nr:hypothetical protein [Hymenobacter sp. NBH84]QNE40747.1 hypothetical protein F1C16_14820 [Hymenobacter sp. NBH84]
MTVIGRVPGIVYFTPTFNGQSYVELERRFTLSKDKAKEVIQSNEGFVMQKLDELSAAGWELVTTTSQTGGKDETDYVRYLFRKAY